MPKTKEVPGDPDCICQGTGLTTRLTETGNTGPEVCECVIQLARKQGAEEERGRDRTATQERQRIQEALKPVVEKLERIRDLDEQTSDGALGSLARHALDDLAALDTLDPSGEGIEIEDRELEPWEQDEARAIVERLVAGLRQVAGPRTDEAVNVSVAAQNVHLAADLLAAQLRQRFVPALSDKERERLIEMAERLEDEAESAPNDWLEDEPKRDAQVLRKVLDSLLETGARPSWEPPSGEQGEEKPRYVVRRDDEPEPAEHPDTGEEDNGPAYEVWDTWLDSIESDWFSKSDAQKEADLLNAAQPNAPATDPSKEEREARVHELKCWPPYFEHVLLGQKTFEVRSIADPASELHPRGATHR